MKLAKLALLFLLSFNSLMAEEVQIPLEPIRQPSDDLVHNGQLLTSEQAWSLSNRMMNPLDLSKLNPQESRVWKNNILRKLDASLDEIPLNEEDEVNFVGTMVSNSGLLRFNVLPSDPNANKFFTIVMEKTLHTYLLRKNLLRKLGYQIPAMKYLKSIKVTFENIEQRDYFLNRQVPEATYGATSRWTKKKKDEYGDALTITFYDVVAMMPKETDHYNVAIGVPPKRITNRTLRSLAIPYALLNVGESVNKLSWYVGREDNKAIILPHFTLADLDTTVDDAKWALERLNTFDRSDFEEIVALSFFPHPVDKVVLEKLLSRRNALNKIFKTDAKELKFDSEVSDGKLLVKGQLTQEDWQGYASRFSHGQPDSPFQDFQYFVFSKIQTAMMENLIDLANKELSVFDPTEERLKFHQNQFEEGLNHFVETGEFKEFGVGTWVSPTLDGNLIVSRDIVVGNYLGTDNMVQLADTFGASISLGAHIGVENIKQWPTAAVRAGVSAMRTYTHLKPVKTLKATFKEPYQNIIVPFVKMKLKKKLDALADFNNERPEEETDEERSKALEELMMHLNRNLGVGESLIVTDKLSPSVLASGSFNMMETRFSLGLGADYALVRRLHIYRKDNETIHVYEDRGRGWSVFLSANVDHYIPVIRFVAKRHQGKYKVKMHKVNINPDLEENPTFFQNATALHHLLEEGSSELLEEQQAPYKIKANFTDKSTKFGFLVWRSKYLKGDNEISVISPKGKASDFLSLTDQSQQGINYQSFMYDVLNYYMGKWFTDYSVQLNTERWKNPAHSIYGISETFSARYEARLKGEGEDANHKELSRPFISLSTRREGWSAGKNKMKKIITKINTKYGKVLFDRQAFDNAKGLKLFDVTVNTNLYEDGIERLENITEKEIKNIERRYRSERRGDCTSRRNRRIRTSRTMIECGNLNLLVQKSKECKRLIAKENKSKERAKCVLQFAKDLNRYLEFKDFKKLVGEENLYVFGTINGFRAKSEILNDPIQSSTIGEVGGRYWNGPVQAVKEVLEIQNGEFHGSWMRESL